MTHPAPPALAVRLLRLRLPDEVAEAVIGDLTEAFEDSVELLGRRRAALDFWREALTVRAGALRKQARRLRRAQALRYGADAPERTPTRIFDNDLMQMLLQDLRLAARRLSARKGFTAVALVSLAIGIGATTTVFGLVNTIFFRGSGVSQPDRVAQIYYWAESSPYWSMSEEHGRQIAEELDGLLETVSLWKPHTGGVEVDGTPRVVFINIVGHDFFRTIGRQPILGRGFTDEEHEVDGAYPVIVIGHSFWQRAFGGDPDVLGREIVLNARKYTIVGVTHPDYRGPAGLLADVFAPLGTDPHLKGDSERSLVYTAHARLRDGVSLDQVQAALDGLGARISQDFPEGAWPTRFSAMLEKDVGVQPGLDQSIRAMAGVALGAGLLVLLVACTNLAGFLLAQGTDRRKEFAVRLALGAERSRVVGQLLVESLLIGVLGGALGLFAAFLLTSVLASVNPPLGFPIQLDLAIDLRVVAFASLLVVFASIVFGLLPALQTSKPEVASTLRDESAGGGEGGFGGRARRFLVVAQVALSMVVLVAAGLFVRSLAAQLQADPGFRTDGLAMVEVHPGPSGYEDDERVLELYRRILDEGAALPGVGSVALASRLPLQVLNWNMGFEVPGVDNPIGRSSHSSEVAYVSPTFFDVMEIPILEGRSFTVDDNPDSPRVVIVSEGFARVFWPGEEAVGRTIHRPRDPENSFTVVGVARQAKVDNLSEGENVPFIYRPILQTPTGTARIVTSGSVSPAEMAGQTQRMVKSIDPNLFVPEILTIGEHVGVMLYLPRLGTIVLTVFGVLALILAAFGLYGIVSFTVARRTREVGIRLSLGAETADVVRLMMGGGLKLVVGGALLGLVVAVAGGKVLSGFLFGITAWDPITLLLVPAVLVGVGFMASWLPARRASRIDPVRALRTE